MMKMYKAPLAMGLGVLLAFGAAAPAIAFVAPGASLLEAAKSEPGLTKVQFRGGRGMRGGRGFGGRHAFAGRGFRAGHRFAGRPGWHRGWRGGYGGGYGYGGAAIGAGIVGLAAGAALAGAANAAPVGGDGAANCESRYRSYNPDTGTYRGYDGLDHPCP